MNGLSEWLRTNGFYSSAGDTIPMSHVTFDGKKIYLPASHEYEFRKRYAREMDLGTPLYYIERRTDAFRYMMDLDILDDHPWSREELENIGRIIQACVARFYPEEHSVICCASPPKTKNGKIHTGVHLIWNDITTNSEKAITIRHAVVKTLAESGIQFQREIEDVVDELVYTRAGYRMVGSDKYSSDKGPENRKLRLVYCMNANGTLRKTHYERLASSTFDLVMETAIRCVESTETPMPITIPAEFGEYFVKTVAPGSGLVGISVTSEMEHSIVNAFITANIPGYAHCLVKSVVRYPDQNLLVKTNSKFCINVGREHNSCSVYFFASPRGICQKCFCRCNSLAGRKHGLCKDFRSRMYPFPDNIVKALFPDYVKDTEEEVLVQVKSTRNNEKKRRDKIFDSFFT